MSTSAFLSLHSNFQAVHAGNTVFEWGRPATGRALLGDAESHACCHLVRKGAVDFLVRQHDRWQSYQLARGDVVCTSGIASCRFMVPGETAASDTDPVLFAPIAAQSDAAFEGPELLRASVPLRLLPHMRGLAHLQLISGASRPLYAGNIAGAFESVVREMAQPAPAPLIDAMVTHHIKTISMNIARARFHDHLTASNSHASGPVIERMLRALSKALGSRRFDWTMEELAHEAGMSRTNFYNHCRQFLNASPMALLARARLRTAAALLLTEQCSVEAAATACGYESATTFIRAFSREFGTAPGRWRRDALQAKPLPETAP